MNFLRTPDERFVDLPGYDFEPHYLEVDGLRVHYLDEGPSDAAPVLLLHGEPSWSYLYRHMIPVLASSGRRVLAPDLIGFGRSDKLPKISDYSYQKHVDWMAAWLQEVDIKEITLFCQDWGSLIGLRLAAEHSERFARVVVGNGGLPTGDQRLPWPFFVWQFLARWLPIFPAGKIIQAGCAGKLAADIVAAYNAPFPSEKFKAAARAFPQLVPTRPDDPAAAANRAAWEVLKEWQKPFLTAFSTGDPITRGGEKVLQKLIPGAAGHNHVTIKRAGHFLQEDKGEELAQVILRFIEDTEGGRQPAGSS